MTYTLQWYPIPNLTLKRSGHDYKLNNIRRFLINPIGVSVTAEGQGGIQATIQHNNLIIRETGTVTDSPRIDLTATRGDEIVKTSFAVYFITKTPQTIITGPTGATGMRGPTEAAGLRGEMGATGAIGARCPKRDTGNTGNTGDTGATGEPCPKGDKGDTGTTSEPGPKGDTGDTGTTGSRGSTGATGARG